MKQILKYSIIATILNLILITNLYSSSTIVLSQQQTKDKIEIDRKLYKDFIKSNKYLKEIKDNEMFRVSVEPIYSSFLLKVDSISNPKVLAGIFLELKTIFPNAFIIQNSNSQNIKPQKIEYIKKNNEQLLWFAIFGLALVGIFALYSSSIQIRNILIRHKLMQDKQNKIEGFLTNIGENIYSLSKKNIGYKSENEDGIIDKSPTKVMIEKKLFDTTRVMIHFLRIKSKRIKIIEEQFNLSNVLNGVLGLLSHRFEGSNIELIFDVDNNVPKSINGDPLHLSEVLTELLQNAITYTTQGEVKLVVSIETSFGNQDRLKFEIIDTGGGISNSELEMLFIPSYTGDGEYKGLGLFVAKELTHLMGGELNILKSNETGTTFVCTIPFIRSSTKEDKLTYILPKDLSIQKKVLIYDHNENSAEAIKKMFLYFKIEAEIISPQKFNSDNIDLSIYDIILLDIHRLEKNQIANIRDIRKGKSLKIVHLTSVFSTKRVISHDYVDDWLEKPINQERIYELILTLFDKKTQEEAKKHLSKKLKIVKPDNLVEINDISTNNFINFKGRNLLIVEDNVIDQKVMYSILSKAGINITIANHGEEALEYLDDDSNQYDLILMDISMPIMDGYEAITKIRNQTKFDNIPIIALTSLALDNDINKIFRVGSNGYLRKPLKIGYLYAIIKEFLLEENRNIAKKIIPKQKVYNGIDGLDTQKGISHSNGSEELYREVLDEFLSAYGDSANSLKVWVQENRYEHIKRLCLDMKGLTGTIGAYKMFELVDTMHKQFLYNNVHLIPKFVESYEEELKKLIITINEYMDDE